MGSHVRYASKAAQAPRWCQQRNTAGKLLPCNHSVADKHHDDDDHHHHKDHDDDDDNNTGTCTGNDDDTNIDKNYGNFVDEAVIFNADQVTVTHVIIFD